VTFAQPVGYEFTVQNADGQGITGGVNSDADPVTGAAAPVTVVSGDVIDYVDAGLYQPASIGDFVWIDANGDGLQDAGEPGLNGVTVNLLDAGGAVIATTLTADDGMGNPGYYLFDGLAPGTYSVQFVAPTGYVLTAQDADGAGITGEFNSDADPVTGQTAAGDGGLGRRGDLRGRGLVPADHDRRPRLGGPERRRHPGRGRAGGGGRDGHFVGYRWCGQPGG
jgi:serine-aspartate repeat-containing protein C/D/E